MGIFQTVEMVLTLVNAIVAIEPALEADVRKIVAAVNDLVTKAHALRTQVIDAEKK